MEIIVLLVALFGLYALLSWLTKKYAFSRLSYYRSINKHTIFPGDSFTLSVNVINKKLLPLPFIEISEKMPSELEYEILDNVELGTEYNHHISTMMLLPYQKITRMYRVGCGKRGRYSFSSVKITAGDYLGLKTFSRDYEDDMEILVYPEVKHVGKLIIDYRNPMGDVSVKRWIIDDPNIIMGIREYTGNDPFNRIHWPSSAKLGELMVKNYDFTSDQRAVILLNIETSKPFWFRLDAEKIEKAVEIAASISSELIDGAVATGIFTNASLSGYNFHDGNYIEPSSGNGQVQRILELLARVTYSIQDSFEDILHRVLESQQTGIRYIIITPIMSDEMLKLIRSINELSGVTVIALSPEKLELLPGSTSVYTIREGGAELEAV